MELDWPQRLSLTMISAAKTNNAH
jgi:hypothetical protein